ncbi:MAG: hypothetical protein PW788_08755 [Micavibrio sp.]|nr:hypothetical protein [Micavibrio sp.]
MRRSYMLGLTSVSLAALVSVATSSQALTPQNLGTLKQLDSWKVGIVDPEGQSFCAMVNKFDKNVGLAFAMSPEGYGSVAIDVADKSFTPGDVYQVSLKTGGQNGTYPGKATSDRSLVVQIGQNKDFYGALKSDAALGVGLPALNVSFALNQFGKTYGSLIDCSETLKPAATAAGLMPAVKVKEVEQSALSPLDAELQKMSGDKTAVATAEKTSAVTDKSASFDDAEAKLDTPATKADVKAAATKLASADAPKEPEIAAPLKADIDWNDQKTEAVKAEIGAQKEQVAQLQDQKQKVERKLLASMSTGPAATDSKVAKVADTNSTAKSLEAQQLATTASAQTLIAAQEEAAKKEAIHQDELAKQAELAEQEQAKKDEDAKQQALLKQAEDAGKARIAALDAAKTAAAAQHVNDFNTQQQKLDDKSAALQKQVAKLETAKTAAVAAPAAAVVATTATPDDKALKATIVAKQAQIASIEAERAKQTEQLTQKLAATQTEYQQKLVVAESDRDLLKRQLADAIASQKASGDKIAALQTQIDAASSKTSAVVKLSAADKAKLAELQSKLTQSESDRQQMQTRLAALESQGKVMEATLTTKQAELEKTSAGSKELAAVKSSLDSLKTENAATVGKLQKQLADKSSQYDSLNGQFTALKNSTASTASASVELAKQRKELTDQLAEKQNHVTDLEQKLAKLENEHAQTVAAADQAKATGGSVIRRSLVIVNDDDASVKDKAELAALAEKDKVALNDARSRITILEGQLQASRDQIGSLQKDISTAKTASIAPSDMQVKALSEQTAKLDQAQGEIDKLKTANLALEGKMKTSLPTAEQVRALDEQRSRLDQSQAEVARLKATNADISAKLADAQASAAAAAKTAAAAEAAAKVATANIPAKADTKTTAELEQSRSRIADLESQVRFQQQRLAAVQGKKEEATLAAVSAPKPQHKPMTAREIAKRDAATRDLFAVEPAAGDADLTPVMSAPVAAAPAVASKAAATDGSTINSSWFNGKIPAAAEQPVVDHAAIAPKAPVVQMAAVAPTVAPVAAPAAKAPADPSFDENRAAAFLDRIMSYHTGVAPKAAATGDDAPIMTPVRDRTSAIHHLMPQPGTASTAPVIATPQKSAALNTAKGLSDIETAAGVPSRTPDIQPTLSDSLPPMDTLAPVMAATVKSKPVANTAAAEAPQEIIAAPAKADISWNDATPAAVKAPAVATTAPVAQMPAAPAIISQKPVMAAEKPVAIAPAPVAAAPVAVAPATTAEIIPAQLPVAEEALAPIVNEPVIAKAPVVASASPAIPVVAASALHPAPIENILSRAGINDAKFTPVAGAGNNVRQWTTRGISGMYEQSAANGTFAENVQKYLARYRSDCKALQVKMEPGETAGSTMTQQASVNCPVEGNTYSTSFVFFQQGSTFNAILHSGFPSDAGTVERMSDGIAAAVTGKTPVAPLVKTGMLSPSAADAAVLGSSDMGGFHLHVPNMPKEPVAATGSATFGQRPKAADDFETVVVQ